jgi:hypothetical protein
MTTPARNAQTAALEALIEAHAIELKLPTVRRRFRALAAEALREQQTPVAYLGALLEAEMAERAERREKRRLIDARFPQIKRLEDFRFADNPKVPQATIAALAEGSWIDDHRAGASASHRSQINTTVRGWIDFYGRFYRTELIQTLKLINDYLVRWAMREYKRLRGHHRRARQLLADVARREPALFAHWQAGCGASGWVMGAR